MARVSIRIGKRPTTPAVVVKEMLRGLVRRVARDKLESIAPAIMGALTTDMMAFARQAGQAFTSQDESPVGFDDLRIPFAPLAPATVKRKMGNRTFFHDTGALRQALDAYLPALVAETFELSIETTPDKVIIHLFRGSSPPAALQAPIVTGQWSAAGRPEADAPGDILHKLLDNPRSWVGPALAYWTLVRAREVAIDALDRSLR